MQDPDGRGVPTNSAYMYGNEMCLINDARISPLEDPDDFFKAPNTRFVYVCIQGFPFSFIATTQDVATGVHLLV